MVLVYRTSHKGEFSEQQADKMRAEGKEYAVKDGVLNLSFKLPTAPVGAGHTPSQCPARGANGGDRRDMFYYERYLHLFLI